MHCHSSYERVIRLLLHSWWWCHCRTVKWSCHLSRGKKALMVHLETREPQALRYSTVTETITMFMFMLRHSYTHLYLTGSLFYWAYVFYWQGVTGSRGMKGDMGKPGPQVSVCDTATSLSIILLISAVLHPYCRCNIFNNVFLLMYISYKDDHACLYVPGLGGRCGETGRDWSKGCRWTWGTQRRARRDGRARRAGEVDHNSLASRKTAIQCSIHE